MKNEMPERIWVSPYHCWRYEQQESSRHQYIRADIAQPQSGDMANSFEALRRANIDRDAEWCADAKLSLSYRGNELAGEVGELCNVLKKLDREAMGLVGTKATREQIEDELGDVFICADLIAMHIGLDTFGLIARKFNKTSEKYGLQTKITPLTQPEFEVVDVDSIDPIIDRSAARHLMAAGYQIVRKKGGE